MVSRYYASELLGGKETEIVDWLSPIAEEVKNNAKKRKANLTLHAKTETARVKADAATNPIKTLGELSKLSKTASNAYKQYTAAQQSNAKAEEALRLQEYQTEFGKDYKQKAAELKYGRSKQELQNDDVYLSLIKVLKRKAEEDPRYIDVLKEVESNSATALIRDRELAAKSIVPRLTKDIFENDPVYGMSLEEKERYSNLSSSDKLGAFKLWQKKNLAFLELDPGMEAAILAPELKRQTNTTQGVLGAQALSAYANEKQLAFANGLEAAIKLGAFSTQSFLSEEMRIRFDEFDYTDIEVDGKVITAQQQVTNSMHKDLIAAATDAGLGVTPLAAYLQATFPHAAGKGGEGTAETVFFSKEQVNQLITAAELGEGRKLGVEKGKLDGTIPQIRSLMENGQTEQAGVLIADLKNSTFYSDQDISQLENINAIDNSAATQKQEMAILQPFFDRGDVEGLKKAATNLKSSVLQDKVNAIVKRHETAREHNYSDGWLDILVQEGMSLTFKEEDGLNHRGISVRNDIRDVFNRYYYEEVEKNPNDPDNFGRAKDLALIHWKNNGGKDGTDKNPIKGKYTSEKRGRYGRFEQWNRDRIAKKDRRVNLNRRIGGTNSTAFQEIKSQANDALDVASKSTNGNVTEFAMETSEAFLTESDVIGQLEGGRFSQETIVLAKLLGVTPEKLRHTQTLAYIEANADKLGEALVKDLKDANDAFDKNKAFTEAMSRITDKDLLYIYTRQGIENTSPNQLRRIITHLQSTRQELDDTATAQAKAQLLEINRKKAQEKRDTIMKGIQETEDERRGIYQ